MTYELHDFFLFHYLAEGAAADKLWQLAQIAFAGEYSDDVIGDTLDKFLKRFKSAQYFCARLISGVYPFFECGSASHR